MESGLPGFIAYDVLWKAERWRLYRVQIYHCWHLSFVQQRLINVIERGGGDRTINKKCILKTTSYPLVFSRSWCVPQVARWHEIVLNMRYPVRIGGGSAVLTWSGPCNVNTNNTSFVITIIIQERPLEQWKTPPAKKLLYLTWSWLIPKYFRHMYNVQISYYWSLGNLDFDLSRSIKVRCDDAIGLPIMISY